VCHISNTQQQYVCHISNTQQDKNLASKWYASEIKVTVTDYKLQAKGKEKFRKNAEKMAWDSNRAP